MKHPIPTHNPLPSSALSALRSRSCFRRNFANIDVYGRAAIPLCIADLNNTGDLSPADEVLLLNATFYGSGCPYCLRPCI